MKNYLILLVVVLLTSCKNEKPTSVKTDVDTGENVLTANEIINKSIEISGGDRYNNSIIKFDFRDKTYAAKRLNGQFSFVRRFAKNNDSITDFYDNSGFKRMINDDFVKVEDSMAKKYTASINSVHYFSILPYGLNDKSVIKTLLGTEHIKGQDYNKIKVSFNQKGGGEDYEDIFIYWIDKESFKTNYLAYSYNEDDGVGMRFREAYNERYVSGLRFVDYNNFKSEANSISLENLGKAFEENQLKLLSKIELKNIKVDLIND